MTLTTNLSENSSNKTNYINYKEEQKPQPENTLGEKAKKYLSPTDQSGRTTSENIKHFFSKIKPSSQSNSLYYKILIGWDKSVNKRRRVNSYKSQRLEAQKKNLDKTHIKLEALKEFSGQVVLIENFIDNKKKEIEKTQKDIDNNKTQLTKFRKKEFESELQRQEGIKTHTTLIKQGQNDIKSLKKEVKAVEKLLKEAKHLEFTIDKTTKTLESEIKLTKKEIKGREKELKLAVTEAGKEIKKTQLEEKKSKLNQLKKQKPQLKKQLAYATSKNKYEKDIQNYINEKTRLFASLSENEKEVRLLKDSRVINKDSSEQEKKYFFESCLTYLTNKEGTVNQEKLNNFSSDKDKLSILSNFQLISEDIKLKEEKSIPLSKQIKEFLEKIT